MIGWLKGTIQRISEDHAILNCNGVGYQVYLSQPDLEALSRRINIDTELFIHTHVREDLISLFGFVNEAKKDFFLILQGISGIGAKTALNMLSVMTPEQLAHAISQKDITLLTRCPGIGRKTAERIVLELHDRIGKIPTTMQTISPQSQQLTDQVLSALVNLGYRRNDAEVAIRSIAFSPATNFDTMFRETLKTMSKA